jgi:cysteinyl-tRNA synthetase
LLERHDPQAIRLLFLQTGYRKVMNFTEESIAAAAVTLRQLKRKYRALTAGERAGVADAALLAKIEAALDDDMNTAVALAELLGDKTASLETFTRAIALLGLEPNPSWLEEPKAELPADFVERVSAAIADVSFNGATPQEALDRVMELRTQARARKEWAESDRLRDALLACGVELKDSKEGTAWTVAGLP